MFFFVCAPFVFGGELAVSTFFALIFELFKQEGDLLG